MAKKWKPKVGDKLYLRLPNAPMGLLVNEVYGKITDIYERSSGMVDKPETRYIVSNIVGKDIDFSEDILRKWFLDRPIDYSKAAKVKTRKAKKWP